MKKPKKAVINKILDVISTVIIILLLICVISNFQTTFLGKKYNAIFGYTFFEVETGSMAGTLEIGDWIIVKVTKDVDTDDVITFEQDGAIITHRVIESYGNNLITMGDSNNVKDNPITRDNVIGKVVKVLPKFSLVKKTFLNAKVLILLFAIILVTNSIFNKDLAKKVLEKGKKPVKKEIIIEEPTEEEKKVKEIIDNVPATSKTTLLSKVDVGFGNNMITKVKDAFEEPEEVRKKRNDDDEPSFDVAVKEESFAKMKAKIKAAEEEERLAARDDAIEDVDFENLNIDAEKRKSRKAILDEFLKEADALDQERSDAYDTDLEVITKRLGIDAKIEIGKDEKSIIKKYFALKIAEIKRLFYIICETDEDNAEFRALINKFSNLYMEAVYYKASDPETIANPLLNISKILAKFYNKLVSDTDGVSRRKNIQKVYLAANAILQIELSDFEDNTVNKIFNSPKFEYENATEVKKTFIKEYKKFLEAYKLFLKRINTNKLSLELDRITGYNLYVTGIKSNIKFSKIFSDYIINKTYNEAIIFESLKEVEMIQLTSEIVQDLIRFDAKRKFLLYLPESLYNKPKKLGTMLKLIDDEYSQGKVFILVNESILKNNIKELGNLKKLGYTIFLETTIEDLKTIKHDKIHLYISNIVIVDEKEEVSLRGINIEGLDKDDFIIVKESCITGVDYK